LTDEAELFGPGKVAVGGAELVSGPRGLYRALARDWNWKVGFALDSLKAGFSFVDLLKFSEPVLALRWRGGVGGGTSPAPSWNFLVPSRMLLARLTLSGSNGFVFSPTLAAYGVR
jgi:hypothetical protein